MNMGSASRSNTLPNRNKKISINLRKSLILFKMSARISLRMLGRLGAKVGHYHFSAWFMSAQPCLKTAIQELERKWGYYLKAFPRQILDIHGPAWHHPELDTISRDDA
jgi:hypothetical protein